MEKYSFFDSVNGDRTYLADSFVDYFDSFIGNGVFANPSNALQVIANDDMTITIKAGKAWDSGYMYHNTSDLILTLDNADGGSDRHDRIVIQRSRLGREIKAVIKKGTIGGTKAPDLQRDADINELGIATIHIKRGAIKITQGDITDTRLDKSVCGVVTGLLAQADTTSIFNQYQQWMKDKQAETQKEIDLLKSSNAEWRAKEQGEVDKIESDFQADFTAWFDNVKNQLSDNQAGNLQNQINTNRDNITQVKDTDLPNLAKELRNDIADTQITTIMGVF